MTHFKSDVGLTATVYYKFLNKEGKPIPAPISAYSEYYDTEGKDGHACFSGFYQSAIPKEAIKIHIFHQVKMVPYSRVDVKRYIDDLNEMGFPCRYVKNLDKVIKIELNLKDYKWKSHLCSTLTLLRVLWESGLAKIPDYYFEAMEANPKADKFIEIQKAHKHPNLYNYGGHTIAAKGTANISRKAFFEKIETSKKEVYDTGNAGINKYWSP